MPTTPLPAVPTGTARIAPTALQLVEAAAYISMSTSWLKHSDVPRVRLGKRAVVYLVKDLDAYLAARRSHGEAA